MTQTNSSKKLKTLVHDHTWFPLTPKTHLVLSRANKQNFEWKMLFGICAFHFLKMEHRTVKPVTNQQVFYDKFSHSNLSAARVYIKQIFYDNFGFLNTLARVTMNTPVASLTITSTNQLHPIC